MTNANLCLFFPPNLICCSEEELIYVMEIWCFDLQSGPLDIFRSETTEICVISRFRQIARFLTERNSTLEWLEYLKRGQTWPLIAHSSATRNAAKLTGGCHSGRKHNRRHFSYSRSMSQSPINFLLICSCSLYSRSKFGFLQGDCATVLADFEASNDGEISVEKGECVEVLDRTPSGDLCQVRVKTGGSVAYHSKYI